MPIEYNWRPQKCEICRAFGHTIARYHKNENGKTTLMWLMKDGVMMEKEQSKM